jgi:hypothetical protein
MLAFNKKPKATPQEVAQAQKELELFIDLCELLGVERGDAVELVEQYQRLALSVQAFSDTQSATIGGARVKKSRYFSGQAVISW